MLEQQPAIDVEMRWRLCANAPDAVQSGRAGSQGRRRFEAHITLCQMRIVSGDVGRVGNNNIETFILQRFEPSSALASGADGLDGIRRICAQAKAHLNVNGWLLFEHGYDQASQVRALLQQSGFAGVFSARDLSGVERVSGGSCLPWQKT